VEEMKLKRGEGGEECKGERDADGSEVIRKKNMQHMYRISCSAS
jgi:hypothetical protein